MSDSEWIGKTKGDITSDVDKFVPPLPPERKYKPDQIKVSRAFFLNLFCLYHAADEITLQE